MVKIRDQVYPFLLDASKLKTYRYRGSKTVQTILYSLEDAIPIDPENLVKIAQNAKRSGITKIDQNSAALILRAHELLLGDETRTSISVDEIQRDMVARGEDPGQIISDFTAATGILSVTRPLPDVVEYLTERLMVSPSAFSTGLFELKTLGWEWKRIANPSKGPFKHWLLLILAVVSVGGTACVMVLGYEAGWFDNFGSPGGLDWNELASQFPGGPPNEILSELTGVDILPTPAPVAPVIEDPGIRVESEPVVPEPVAPAPAPASTVSVNPAAADPSVLVCGTGTILENDTCVPVPAPPAPAPVPAPSRAPVQTNPDAPLSVTDLPPDVLTAMLARYLAETSTPYPEFVLPPGVATNSTVPVIGCGHGTILFRGLCVASDMGERDPSPVPVPELPEWHPGVPTAADRIYEDFTEYRDGVTSSDTQNRTVPDVPLHSSGFTLEQLEALCFTTNYDNGDWCIEYRQMQYDIAQGRR